MNHNGNMDDLDPLPTLGELVRAALKPPEEPEFREFTTPGFHKQSNGMLAYVPDMQKLGPRYGPLDLPEETPVEPEPEEDLYIPVGDVHRVGLYLSENGWLRWYDGNYWHLGFKADNTELNCARLPNAPIKNAPIKSGVGFRRLDITCEELLKFKGTPKDLMEMLQATKGKPTYPCAPERITTPGFYITNGGWVKHYDGMRWSYGYMDPSTDRLAMMERQREPSISPCYRVDGEYRRVQL